MKLISWNVGGIQRRINDGTLNEVFDLDPDIFCLQEVHQKTQNLNQDVLCKKYYKSFFYPSLKYKQACGVATYSKYDPISLNNGFNIQKYDVEGRIQKIEFEHFDLYNVYFPSGSGQEQLEDKYEFYDLFTKYVKKSEKPQVICGDFNRMSKEIDGWNPKKQCENSGFLPEEQKWFKEFLEDGFIDSFRLFDQEGGNYTWWWSKSFKKENKGIRFDYFLVNEELKDNITNASILNHIGLNDHAPITLELEF